MTRLAELTARAQAMITDAVVVPDDPEGEEDQ
jgi:hypothetical protein